MEGVNSILDTIKERATNPFFGTVLGVWLFRHFEFLYGLFNFDDGTTLAAKQIYIRNYIHKHYFWEELFINTGIALGLVLLAFALLVVTRIIANIANHRLTPYFNHLTVSKLVVNNTRFLTVKKQRDEFFSALEDAQETIVNLEQKNRLLRQENVDIELLKQENASMLVRLEKAELSANKAESELTKLTSEYGNQVKKFNQLNEVVAYHVRFKDIIDKWVLDKYTEPENVSEEDKTYLAKSIPVEMIRIYERLRSTNTIDSFIQFLNHSDSYLPFDNPGFTALDFVELEKQVLIEKKSVEEPWSIDNSKLTALGYIFSKYFPSMYKSR